MAFNPSSTIYFCNVPIDPSYKHQLYFANKSAQRSYFVLNSTYVVTEYLTVRNSTPDGAVKHAIRIDRNIDELYGFNYIHYQNANHGDKWFYAFITNLKYINDRVTEVEFEQDVWQTWMFDVELLPSFVVRQHSEVDFPGSNTVPEKFSFSDFEWEEIQVDKTLDDWGYLIATSEHDFDQSWWEETFKGSRVEGKPMSGIYQGLYFFYFENYSEVNSFLESATDKALDCILFIQTIPAFCLDRNVIGTEDGENDDGWVGASNFPAYKTITLDFAPTEFGFGKETIPYTPRNAKLYTYPYMAIDVTTQAGRRQTYAMEDFPELTYQFEMYGDVSGSPSIMLVPKHYKGITENIDFALMLSDFPQCSFATDTYKLWQNRVRSSMWTEGTANMIKIIAGGALAAGSIAATPATAGASSLLTGAGVTTMISGARGIGDTILEYNRQEKESDRMTMGGGNTNLLTALGENKFRFYMRKIKRPVALQIDNYFTMFGYAVNNVQTPNIHARINYTYVETADVNVVGGIPSDDLLKIKAMFNGGVTFWSNGDNVGNYFVNNEPATEGD